MLLPRIIPCLLVHDGGLVKTVRFASPKYVGDPINAVRIFNEKRVDELVVLDIDASVRGREPNFEMIGHLAAECRMPLCYGGGVKTVAQAERIISIGVEKVAMSSAAVEDPKLLTSIAEVVGSQSVVVVMDVKKAGRGKYEVWLDNGTRSTGLDAVDFARSVERLGVGEVVVNSIDNDGLMKGYDLDLVEAIRGAVNIPMTVLGGAGSLQDIKTLLDRFGIMGAAAGSLFVFKGAYRAVLINYPNPSEKQRLLA